MSAMPALFISHGSPMLALEDGPTTQFLRQLASGIPTPSAIVVASAHWETDTPHITGAQQPETIHDFHGFPKSLYDLRYPAPGDPELVRHIQSLLAQAQFPATVDTKRGLDHGAWNPLLLMYPKATIPVIEISVQPTRDAGWHYAVGQALAPLRNDNILVIGTGNLTHNLREAMRGHHATTPTWVTDFAEWIAARIAANDIASLLDWLECAPYAKENHPTPEHLLPLFIAMGAAGMPLHANRIHSEIALGVLAMDTYIFG